MKPSPALNARAAALEFAVVIRRMSARELSNAGDCSIETAKFWKKGRSFPHGYNLINLARRIPEIRVWLLAKTEGGQ